MWASPPDRDAWVTCAAFRETLPLSLSLWFCLPRCEVGTDSWVQCNDSPVKICKYPVTGLIEGRSYLFRVRAINSAGVSRPSRVSAAVAALDPTDLRRLQGRCWQGPLAGPQRVLSSCSRRLSVPLEAEMLG